MKFKQIGYIVTIIGLAALYIYLKRLFTIKLTVDEKEAIYYGQRVLKSGSNIIAFTAHPDDLEFFMGGTLKLLTNRQCKVTVVDVTDGEKGVNRKNLAPIRRKEQQNAAKILNIDNLKFLHLPDLNLSKEEDLKQTLQNVLLEVNPDVIFAFDYQYPLRAIKHPDHIAVGKTVQEIKNQFLNKETYLFFYASRYPNALINILATIKEKISSVRCHKSQLRFNYRIYDYATIFFAKYTAKNSTLKYAESFRIEKELF